MGIIIDVQDEPTSRGHYWTATTEDKVYDGQGHDREAAILDLIENMKQALDIMSAQIRRAG